jgi:hypothetical protein
VGEEGVEVLLHLGCILGHDIKFSCLHYGYEVGFFIIVRHSWYDLVRVRAFLSILCKEEGGSGFGKGIAGDMKLFVRRSQLLFVVATCTRQLLLCFFLVGELGKVFLFWLCDELIKVV